MLSAWQNSDSSIFPHFLLVQYGFGFDLNLAALAQIPTEN